MLKEEAILISIQCEALMISKENNKRDVYKLLKKANEFRKNKDYKKAIRYYKRALEQHPNDYRMYSVIGYTYYEWEFQVNNLENIKKAAEWFEKALEFCENPCEIYSTLAFIYSFAFNDYKKAYEIYQLMLELDPHSSKAMMGISSLYGPPDSPVLIEEAIEMLKKYCEIFPEDSVFQVRLGYLLLENDNKEEAMRRFCNGLRGSKPYKDKIDLSLYKDG